MNIWLAALSIILILVGTIGSVLPLLPGIPLSFVGLLIYGIFTNFESVGVLPVVIFGVLTLITLVVDFLAPALGTRGYKSSSLGSTGAVLGALFGIVLGPLGILFGPFVGAFIGEMISHANHEKAFRVALGAFVGFLVGSFFKLVIGVSMLVYFLIALF